MQAPQAPWGGPGTTIGPQNTMAMMLALLWPDLAGPLADPALLAAARATASHLSVLQTDRCL